MNSHAFRHGITDGPFEQVVRPELFDRANRASTIFPIFLRGGTRCLLTFLSYWAWKHDTRVLMRLTLRQIDGTEIGVREFLIDDVRSHSIDVGALFERGGAGRTSSFDVSLEVEVYSPKAPLFTYPAVTLLYAAPDGFSAVHSCARTYNDGETVRDYALGAPQTGFDVVFRGGMTNYVSVPAGNAERYALTLHLDRSDGRTYSAEVELSNTSYGALHTLLVEDIFGPEAVEPGVAKVRIEHDITDVYPRFYCGQITDEQVPTLTHSFFDTSDDVLKELDTAGSALTCKNPDPDRYCDSAFSVPFWPDGRFRTKIVSYGSNKSFTGSVDGQLLAADGTVLASKTVETSSADLLQRFETLDLDEFWSGESGELRAAAGTVRFAFRSGGSNFPRRFKLGLNITSADCDLGSNICFSPVAIGENTIAKPFNRRWMPIGGPNNILGWFCNTSLAVDAADEAADCAVRYDIIDGDGRKMQREGVLRPNGSLLLDVSTDGELKEFLGDEIGWVALTANSYMSDAFYFSSIGSQIGGDHAF